MKTKSMHTLVNILMHIEQDHPMIDSPVQVIILLGGNLISWKSKKKKKDVAVTSSAEVEH